MSAGDGAFDSTTKVRGSRLSRTRNDNLLMNKNRSLHQDFPDPNRLKLELDII